MKLHRLLIVGLTLSGFSACSRPVSAPDAPPRSPLTETHARNDSPTEASRSFEAAISQFNQVRRTPSDTRARALEARQMIQNEANLLQDLDGWNAMSDDTLETVFDDTVHSSHTRADIRKALRKSLHCGNQKCEADIGETNVSCPLDCGRLPISGYNMGTQCRNVQNVFEPKSLEEMKAVLRDLKSRGAKKIRFVGSRHSASSLICTEEYAVVTKGLNRVLKLNEDEKNPWVEIESGAQLGEVWDYLDRHGYTLGYGYPFLRAATLAGMTATGSHGSFRGEYGVSSQNIQEMTFLDLDGNEKTLKPADGDKFKAALVHLGNMGYVYKLRVRIERDFNLRATMNEIDGPGFLDRENKKINWGELCEFHTVAWFFGPTKKAIRICFNRTTDAAEHGAENVMLVHDVSGFRGKAAKYLMHYGKTHPSYMCKVSDLRVKQVLNDSVFVKGVSKSGGEERAFTVVGKSSKIFLSRHIENTNPLFNIHDLSFAIEESRTYEALNFIQEFSDKNKLCLPMTGVMLRFAESNGSSFLSHVEQNGPKKRYIMADFFEYRYFNMDQNIQDDLNKLRIEMFKTLISKYRAVPHSAKNDDWIFQYAIDQGIYNRDHYTRYFKARDEFDPKSLYINQYFEKFRNVAR